MTITTTQTTKEKYGLLFYNYGEEVWKVEKGDRVAQAMFINFLKCDNDVVENTRKGGWGSTNV